MQLPPTNLIFTHSRPSVDLNGAWKFCPDPMQRCRRQKWWRNPPAPDAFFPCWDLEGLWDIQVPGTWKKQFLELKWYDGHAVYVRDFSVAGFNWNEQEAFLAFDGIVYEAEIYLNGEFVARHDRGYSPFTVRVTDFLRAENRLFVLVDNLPRPDRAPGEIFDWNNDGGIINPVKLVFTPRVHVENFRVQTRLEKNDVVLQWDIWLAARDVAATADVVLRVPELGLEQTLPCRAREMTRVETRIPRERVTLWCPETPKLYPVSLTTPWETIQDQLGFREIRTRGHQILLNGDPIYLHGLCVHSDFPETGRTATAEGIARMIARVKDLGVNFLRCAHYPYTEAFGRALDRAGLLWWEETPGYWIYMKEAVQRERAMGILEEAIRRDWNRASLIVWSISNECCWSNPENPQENNYDYWFQIVPRVRELDPSRLVSCAEAGNFVSVKGAWTPAQADQFLKHGAAGEHYRLLHPDRWYDLFDVFAANLYTGPGEAAVVYPRYVRLCGVYGKPLILSEFGHMSLRGCDAPVNVAGSEERHALVIREAVAELKKHRAIAGYCLWSLSDMRAPIHWRWYNQGQAVFRYGLLDENWEEKKVFAVYREELRKHQEERVAGKDSAS